MMKIKEFVKENEIKFMVVAGLLVVMVIFWIVGDPAKKAVTSPTQTKIVNQATPGQSTPQPSQSFTPLPSVKDIYEANHDGSDKFVGTWMWEENGQRAFIKIIKANLTKYEVITVINGETTGGAYGLLKDGKIEFEGEIMYKTSETKSTLEIKEDGLLHISRPNMAEVTYKKLSNEILNVM